ncbi:hypothetical protein Hanom_Chr07g00619951 [Helianthus anomalus]
MLGKSVEQRFEEIEVEEVIAKPQEEIDAQLKNKGKGVEGVIETSERSIDPSTILESPIPNPCPISAMSAIFEEDVLLDDVINDEDDEEEKVDDHDDVISASSHSNNDDDDDSQGGTGVKVTDVTTQTFKISVV